MNNIILMLMISRKVSKIKKKVFVLELVNYFQFLEKKRRIEVMNRTQQGNLKIRTQDGIQNKQRGIQKVKNLHFNILCV